MVKKIMTISEMFAGFLKNLIIGNSETISLRYGEITAALNRQFRDTESKTANSLQVGSFGRKTAIDGISDLDMLYIMPEGSWDKYKNDNGPSKILSDTRTAILARYPNTSIHVDRLVVSVAYTNFHIEVQPVFEQEDQSYKYPDTYDKCWKITKPRQEMDAISDMNSRKNGNLRNLCKMVRAWKNKHGVGIGGLLIDTLAYKFFDQTKEYDDKSYLYYDWLSRDFFKFLSEQPEQEFYFAPGSNQKVKVKHKFQRKAKKAYNLCLDAIGSEKQKNVNDKWKRVYGRPFPVNIDASIESFFATTDSYTGLGRFRNTEQFIEDFYRVDIRYNLKIDCEVSQNGFREHRLRDMIIHRMPLLAKKKLKFFITENTTPKPHQIKWKVLNRGEEAERRDDIRGQILDDFGYGNQYENTKFKGDHVVECYIVKDGVLVAKDRIHVPISTNE
jgi:hypothetical protein